METDDLLHDPALKELRRREASVRFTRVFASTLMGRGSTFSFRFMTDWGLSGAKEEAQRVALQNAREFFQDSDLFSNQEELIRAVGGPEDIAQRLLDIQVQQFQHSVDAASLVFAHSILDSAATECCRISSIAAPEAWEPLVSGRPVSIKLQDLRNPQYQLRVLGEIGREVATLKHLPLKRRIDRLFEICKPVKGFAPIRNYRYDPARLVELDDLRNRVVHELNEIGTLHVGSAEIAYLFDTAGFLALMVARAFDLKIDPPSFARVSGSAPPGAPAAAD